MKYMKTSMLLVIGFFMAAPQSYAQDADGYKVGPFSPGMTVQEAVDAAPELSWEALYYTRTGEQNGAQSTAPFQFAGQDWDVTVGSSYDWIMHDEVSDIDMRASFQTPKRGQCKEAMAQTISELEPIFGAFGLHPEFPSIRSMLYGDPYGEGFKVKPLTEQSKLRLYPKSSGAYRMSTFREPGSDEFFRVMVLGVDDRSEKTCDLRLNIFIPYVFDEEAKAFVVPPKLAERFPGRYKDKPKRRR